MSLSTMIAYRYDSLDRLIGLDCAGQKPITRFYDAGNLSTELRDGADYHLVRHEQHLLAQSQHEGNTVEHFLLATDQQGSVLQSHGARRQDHVYTPYGDQAVEGGLQSLMGFNGEQPDPVTGCYMLGNGYRAYSPVLMRFQTPDSMSPFGAGGINPYTYCIGDPINLCDPTGHFSLKSIFKVILGVLTIGLTVATLVLGAPVSAVVAAGAIVDIVATGLDIASIIANELAPQSKAGAALEQFSMALGLVGFAFNAVGSRTGKIGALMHREGQRTGATLTTLVRQNAMRVSNGQALRSINGVMKLNARSRNTVVWVDRLDTAKKGLGYLKYAGYAWSAAEALAEIIPYFAGPNPQSGSDSSAAPPYASADHNGASGDSRDLQRRFHAESRAQIEHVRSGI